MSRRRIVLLGVPLALLVFAVGFFVGLEFQRGPDWRLELDEYVARHRRPGESIIVREVAKARRPWSFTASMGTVDPEDWISPTFPPRAVRCALLARSQASGSDGASEPVRQVVFLAHHSDTLYHVGWVAYEGPVEPFGPQLRDRLALIGCDLELE